MKRDPDTSGRPHETATDLERDRALMQTLVGRTIVAASWIDTSDGEWCHHEDGAIKLDDGRVIEFSSWGYDADGATVADITDQSDQWNREAREAHGL